MGNLQALFLAFLVCLITFDHLPVHAQFYSTMDITGGAKHTKVSADQEDLELKLDQFAGSGCQSKSDFLFGSVEMQIKLVANDSAGTVTAYYLSSTGNKHDEIDFEFLGNRTGQPYVIHTNIFVQGKGSREHRFYPWFDPTTGYHNYTIHWNPNAVVWFVDTIPIRVFRNYEHQGIPFPNKQGMKVYSSLWNADDWATRGGREKINWKSGPFRAGLRKFRARTCKWKGTPSIYECAYPNVPNWWTSSAYSRLSNAQIGQMKWVRENYLIYDYCKDTGRYRGNMPPECSKPQY